MNDFILFDGIYGEKNAVRKFRIISVYEDEDDKDIVHIETDDSNFKTNEPFDSIISKI